MIKGSLQNSGFFSKVMQLLAVMIFAILIITLLGAFLTDYDMNNIASVKKMQFIQSTILFVACPLLLAYLWSEMPFNYLRMQVSGKPSHYILVAITMIVAIPFINLLTDLNKQMSLPEVLAPLENWMRTTEAQLEEFTLKLVNVHSISDLLFNFLLIAVIAGLGEELFFRGILQKIFSEWRNAVLAIWLAAFVFSAIHLQFYGFFPRMLLGAFFGYLLYWSGNLWLPILAHTINNGLAVIFYYLKFNGYQVVDIDTIGTNETVYLGVISAVLTAICIILLRRNLFIPKHPHSEQN